jgi:hypothetical protein
MSEVAVGSSLGPKVTKSMELGGLGISNLQQLNCALNLY